MKISFLKTGLFIFFVIFGATTSVSQTQKYNKIAEDLKKIQNQLVPDKRIAILDVSLDGMIRPVVTIKGETNLPEAKKQILDLLNANGVQFIDSIRLLPDQSLGDKIWGLATLSVSSMRTGFGHDDEMASQALMGTPLKILDSNANWVRVQTPDNYIGWMEESGVAKMTAGDLDRWKKSDRYFFNRISGNVFSKSNRKSDVISDLVLGDLMEVLSVEKGFLKIRIPDGRIGFIRKSDCISWEDWTGKYPDVQSVLTVAKQLLGVPYLWGGTSCKAVDCSGLTKTSYYSQAVILARDASQQAQFGMHPDLNNIRNFEPGDLLFFGRSADRITHVGLYLGNSKYIHASGLVQINSVDPKDPVYNLTSKKDLVAVSRVMNSLDTKGIVLVKHHPWYANPN